MNHRLECRESPDPTGEAMAGSACSATGNACEDHVGAGQERSTQAPCQHGRGYCVVSRCTWAPGPSRHSPYGVMESSLTGHCLRHPASDCSWQGLQGQVSSCPPCASLHVCQCPLTQDGVAHVSCLAEGLEHAQLPLLVDSGVQDHSGLCILVT
ncbi:hypothetical protein P7K49_027795 [Saguinus oedipus]|uniref:Uncharacterized protein n=1 Tax=Saguinus oedipus TaxID=9490 RepID=A0ABQ9UCQ2_SAGOE|nr:hypothetical protein P7K49_027795 [Saguinus oedipus]